MRQIVSVFSSSRIMQIIMLAGVVILGYYIAGRMFNVPSQRNIVILFAAVFFYPVLRQPVLGVYLYFLVMPFIPFFRRLYYLQFARPQADPLIIVGDLLITLTLIGLFFEFKARKDSFSDTKSFNIVIIGYFLYLLLRTFFFNIYPAQEAIMRFRLYGPSVLLFFIGAFYASNSNALKKIWVLTFLAGIFGALYGLKQLLFGYSEAERIWFSTISFTTLFIKGIARPFSFFQSPAAFADYMQMGLISIIVLSSWSRENISRIFYMLLLPVFFYGALITSVRSNWIGILVSVVLWIFVIQFKSTRSRVIMFSVLITLFGVSQFFEIHNQSGLDVGSVFTVLGGGLTPQYADLLVNDRASAISNPFEEHSLLSRIALWKYLFNLSADPVMAILGRGVGTLNADSLYVTYLAELGYPGMAFIVFLVIFLILKAFSLLDKAESQETRSLARGILVMNAAFAIINITGTHIHSFPGDAYFWFWNGVLINLEAQQRLSFRMKNNEDPDYN